MRMMVMASVALLALAGCAAPEETLAETVSAEAALSRAVTQAAKGARAGAVLDVQGCGIEFAQSAGVANRKTKLAMPSDERLRIASVGKLYTAAVVHQLADQGLLDLGLPATSYLTAGELDGVPNAGATLRQMLNHTSGIPDYYDTRSYLTWDWEQALTTDRVLKVARRRGATNEIGAAYSYSNTNYHILALVAEKTTGESLADLIETQLLVPLGLEHTRYNTEHSGGTIHGYGTELRANADTWKYAENTGPDSGITATTADLSRYLRALFLSDGPMRKIGDRMIQDPVTNKARQLAGPGAEIFVGRNGRRLIGHTGDTFGYLTFAMAIPDYDATIIGHINASKSDVLVELLQSTIGAVKRECARVDAGVGDQD